MPGQFPLCDGGRHMSRQRVVAKVAFYTENNVRTLHHILVHVSDSNFHRISHLTILNDHFVFSLDMWLSYRSISKYHLLSDNIFYCLLRPLFYIYFFYFAVFAQKRVSITINSLLISMDIQCLLSISYMRSIIMG